MERAVVKATEERKGTTFPHSDAEALLLLEVDGNNPDQLDEQIEKIGEVCLKNGSPDLFVAEDPSKQKFIWDLRRSLGETVRKTSPYKEEDTVVPRSRLPELVTAIREVTAKHGLDAMAYGHIGDGNIHVNILKRNLSDEVWNRDVDKAVRELFGRVVALGGTLSGEHGIGYVQRNYLPIAFSSAEIRIMRALKRTFDPNGIMNPRKALPDEDA
jgi:glycolate oxidase